MGGTPPSDASAASERLVEVAEELNVPVDAVELFSESDGALSVAFVAQYGCESESNESPHSGKARVFVKTLPSQEFLLNLCREQQLFEREATCLRQCTAKAAELDQCATLYVPRLRHASASCLAMEHLADLGFSNVPSQQAESVRGTTLRTPLSYQQMRQALSALAEFHALFFDDESALSEFDPLFDEEKHRNFVMGAFDYGVTDLKRLEEKGSLEAQVVASVEQMREHFKQDNINVPRHCFLTHGDLWSPNLLWRDDRVAFVDFQFTKRGEPLHDVYFLLFSAMETEARHEHFDALLEHYTAHLLSLIPADKHAKALQLLRGAEPHARAVRQTVLQLIAGVCDMFLTDDELASRYFAMLRDLGEAFLKSQDAQALSN